MGAINTDLASSLLASPCLFVNILQGDNSSLSRRKRRLTSLDLTSIQLDHAGTTISLLTIDWNLDARLGCHSRQLLTRNGALDGLAIYSDGIIILGAILESSVLYLAEGVIVLEGVAKEKEACCRGTTCCSCLVRSRRGRRRNDDKGRSHINCGRQDGHDQDS